jgi:spoIIIJ-associated protein
MGDRPSPERGQAWLEQLLTLSQLSAPITAALQENFSEQSCWLTIDQSALAPDQITALLGEGGKVLDAMQYLANVTLNMGLADEDKGAYTIELAGYRARRSEELVTIADRAAEAVRESGQEFEIQSLSSAERRQIHTILKEQEGLETISRGQEPDRRLVVKLAAKRAVPLVLDAPAETVAETAAETPA